MTEALETTLETIAHRLFDDSLNYSPSFLVVDLKGMAGRPLRELLELAIGGAVAIGGTRLAGAADVLASVRNALDYQGDDGSHPGRDYLASADFRRDAGLAMSQVGRVVAGADTIMAFELEAGHPFYPVFWDFAFLIEKNGDAVVFIGSSSD